jgi:hypothetical protein
MFAPPIALAAAAAAAQAAPAELAGVWEGTVGDLTVRACFATPDWGRFGAYYYLSRLQLIALEAEEGRNLAFRESGDEQASQPRWQIQRVVGAELTGQWSAGRRTLPLRLRRIGRAEGEDSACGTVTFHQPRLARVRVNTVRGSKDGVGYTRRILDAGNRYEVSLETFTLDGDGAAVRSINNVLGQPLSGNPPHWFECIHDSLQTHGYEGSLVQNVAPAMISSRWLSVTEHWDGDCGGAHPDSSNTYRTFDRTNGREVDLHDWLVGTATQPAEGSDAKLLRPAFRNFILSDARLQDPECRDAVREEEFWNVGLTRSALVFTPLLPHVAQACADPIAVPFARLRPYLTQQAAAHVRALQAERPRP